MASIIIDSQIQYNRLSVHMAKQFNRDSALLISASGIQNASALILQLLLARILLPFDFGRLSIFMSVTTLIALLATGGIIQYLPALSRKRLVMNSPLPFDGVVIAGGFALVVAVLNGAAYYGGLYRHLATDLGVWFVWISLYIIGQSITQSLLNIAIGAGRSVRYVVVVIVLEITRVAGVLLLLINNAMTADTVVRWWTIHSLAGAAVLVVPVWLTSKTGTFNNRSIKTIFDEYKPAFAFFLPVSGSFYLPRLLIFLCGAVAGATGAAYLSVAMTFISIYTIVLQPVQTAFLVAAAESVDPVIKKIPVMVAGTLGLGLGIIVLSHFLIVPLFGESYRAAGSLTVVLALVFLFEWPKAFLDVLWMNCCRPLLLTVFELSKAGLVVLAFVPVLPLSLIQRLLIIGAVFLLITTLKSGILWSRMSRIAHE